MARRIKYKTQCFRCFKWFDKGKAFLTKYKGKWMCQCDDCYKEVKKNG